MIRSLLTLVLLALAATCFAADIWVSPDGSSVWLITSRSPGLPLTPNAFETVAWARSQSIRMVLTPMRAVAIANSDAEVEQPTFPPTLVNRTFLPRFSGGIHFGVCF